MPHGKFQRSFDELAYAYCLRRKSRRQSILHCVRWRDVVLLYGLQENPRHFLQPARVSTCSKAMSWCRVRSAVEFTWSIETFFQYGSPPRRVFWFLGDRIGRLTRVHPFSSDKGLGESCIVPKLCLGFPGAFHRTVLLYYDCQVREVYYVTAAYSIKESFVHAAFAEE